MIHTFDVNVNFWKVHPEMKVVEPFKTVYESDRDKSKKQSSTLMWFIVLCYDRDSKFFRLPADGAEGKHVTVGEDYCQDKDFYKKHKKEVDMCIDSYINLQWTPLERHLKVFEDMLNKRTIFLRDQEYDFVNDEKLDKFMERTKKILDTISTIRKDLAKEEGEGTAKGGTRASLND